MSKKHHQVKIYDLDYLINEEYTEEDLLNGITYEQIMFLKPPYSRKKRYITERIDVNIEDMIEYDR